MSTKHNGGPAASASPSPAAGIDALAETSRRQMAAVVQSGCALFRGFEQIRGIQERAARDALAEYEAVAGKLARPQPIQDLLALQAELLRFDAQGAALYWQQLGAAAFDMQRQLLGSLTAAETRVIKEAAASMQEFSSAMPGLGTLLPPARDGRAARASH